MFCVSRDVVFDEEKFLLYATSVSQPEVQSIENRAMAESMVVKDDPFVPPKVTDLIPMTVLSSICAVASPEVMLLDSTSPNESSFMAALVLVAEFQHQKYHMVR